MAIPSLVTKITLAVAGVGVIGAGIAVPLVKSQSENTSLPPPLLNHL